LQYFNIFICYFTFAPLSLLYQITNKPKFMTQTELQKEIEKLQKQGRTISKKAYCGNEHSSKYSSSLYYIYDRIHKLTDQLKNIQSPNKLQPCNYYQTSF
jgi:hypothetical protein